MTNKFFGLLFALMILIQVSFSFYYSNEIINQNIELNKNQNELSFLKDQNQEMENKLGQITSLNYLRQKIDFTGLAPIQKEIKSLQP